MDGQSLSQCRHARGGGRRAAGGARWAGLIRIIVLLHLCLILLTPQEGCGELASPSCCALPLLRQQQHLKRCALSSMLLHNGCDSATLSLTPACRRRCAAGRSQAARRLQAPSRRNKRPSAAASAPSPAPQQRLWRRRGRVTATSWCACSPARRVSLAADLLSSGRASRRQADLPPQGALHAPRADARDAGQPGACSRTRAFRLV